MIEADFRRMNFHTHTGRCKHAQGKVEDYCRQAVEGTKITRLGFSDHMPFPGNDFHGDVRMSWEELDDYLDEVIAAREKFRGQLEIFVGLEAEFRPELGPEFYREEFRERRRLDYLIGGVHFLSPNRPETSLWSREGVFDAATVRRYVEATVELITSGQFDCVAHPDLWARKTPEWTPEIRAMSKELIEAARSCNVQLEINTYGLRRPLSCFDNPPRPQYPWRPFWELAAECGARVMIGTDAHLPADVGAGLDEAMDFAARCGVVPTLPDFVISRDGLA